MLTVDGVVVVFHDDDASRMLKLKDKINSLTYEELEYLSPYHIPTLNEVLKSIDSKVPIVIEVKEDNKYIRNKLIEILKDYKGKFVIQSFIYDIVKFFKKKNYIVGLLVGEKKNIKYLTKNIDVDLVIVHAEENIYDARRIMQREIKVSCEKAKLSTPCKE